MVYWPFLLRTLFLCSLYPHASAAGPYRNLGDIFQHQLRDLEDDTDPGRSPYLGGQSFARCCRLAVNESLEIDDGDLHFKPGQTHLSGNVSTFLQWDFPCGAKFNGTRNAPSQVWVTYTWCHDHCPGWEISKPEKYSFWIQPLVAFIMPSIVFCLSVPRRRRIQVPGSLFPKNIDSISSAVILPFKVCASFAVVAFDTISWLAAVLALAGPMIISGIYEAVLDLHVLTLLAKKNDMSVQDQAQLLYTVLLGNLDRSPAWDHMKAITSHLPTSNSVMRGGRHQLRTRTSSGVYSNRPVMKPSLSSISIHIESTKIRLKSLLESQYSFGSTVGAAVVFFTGGFVYSLIEIQSTYGVSSTSHRLAFGMFWMIVPHVSVVSSVLLASNNPSSWAGVASNLPRTHSEDLSRSPTPITLRSQSTLADQSPPVTSLKWFRKSCTALYHPSYPCIYHPAWLWNRGTNKAMWLSKLADESPGLLCLKSEVLHLGLKKWLLYCIFPAIFLLIIPGMLGIMISWVTPVVGLSCRSGTIVVYVSGQLLLTMLWFVHMFVWKRDAKQNICPIGVTKKVAWWIRMPWYVLGFLGVFATFFTSIMGTIFTFINLYVNCLCMFPIWHWHHRFTTDFQIYIGGSSEEKVANAMKYWLPCGLSATSLLIAVAYIGWWYQRRLRAQFHHLVETLGTDRRMSVHGEEGDRSPIRRSMTSHSRAQSV